jgi:diguanylate cyclase
MKICRILKKLEEDESDLTQSELELLLDIIKQQLKFMFKYNILITPKNFERWFLVFFHTVENNNPFHFY